jgi:hypothetical protein
MTPPTLDMQGVDDIAGFEWPIAFWCNWIAPLPLALRFG